MEKSNIHISHAILRATSIFEPGGRKSEFISKLKNKGFTNFHFNSESLHFFKNNYYPEFKELIFSNEKTNAIQTFRKEFNQTIIFPREIIVTLNYCDLFIFPNGLSFFMLDFSTSNKTISEISDINFMIQKLDAFTLVKLDQQEVLWIRWIETNCLLENKICSDNSDIQIPIDSYSGSKFKLFSILETSLPISQTLRLELLYDIGCNTKIGSAGGKENYSPSDSYYTELMNNAITVFQNYDILPLFDSFSVIGNDLFTSSKQQEIKETDAYKTWSETYFRLVLFNLYLKFNLFKYNAEVIEDSIKTRERFENFINTYNFSHISFSFLPNLLVKNHRKSLEIDSELDLFQKRIQRISLALQERQQNRMDKLITLITIFSYFGSIIPILKELELYRNNHEISQILFYSILFITFLFISFIGLRFLFPLHFKKIIRKIKRRKNN